MRFRLAATLAAAILVAAILTAGAWVAAGATQGPTQRDPQQAFNQECGACHWAYLPELLPAHSWEKITSDLSHHFGQNASLDATTTQQITGYLTQHAADAPGSNHEFMRGLRAGDTPLRVTDTPLWRAIHEEINPLAFTQPRVKTKSNCMGCHQG